MWINEVMISALLDILSSDITHHFSHNFKEIHTKAEVSQKMHPSGSHADMNLHYIIKKLYMDLVWQIIINQLQDPVNYTTFCFQNPVLVVSFYDFKLNLGHETA